MKTRPLDKYARLGVRDRTRRVAHFCCLSLAPHLLGPIFEISFLRTLPKWKSVYLKTCALFAAPELVSYMRLWLSSNFRHAYYLCTTCLNAENLFNLPTECKYGFQLDYLNETTIIYLHSINKLASVKEMVFLWSRKWIFKYYLPIYTACFSFSSTDLN